MITEDSSNQNWDSEFARIIDSALPSKDKHVFSNEEISASRVFLSTLFKPIFYFVRENLDEKSIQNLDDLISKAKKSFSDLDGENFQMPQNWWDEVMKIVQTDDHFVKKLMRKCFAELSENTRLRLTFS